MLVQESPPPQRILVEAVKSTIPASRDGGYSQARLSVAI